MSTAPDEGTSPQWRAIRRNILKRDGYRCSVFGCNVKGSANLSVHHIIPRPEGGDNPENLITLCHHHHDEIELARVPTAELIRNWTGPDSAGEEPGIVSSSILDALPDDERENETLDMASQKNGFICRPSTEAALIAIKDGRSFVDVANALRYEPSFATTISSIIAGRPGAITEEGEHELRVRLGLESESGETPKDRCPKCGHKHFANSPCLTFAFGTSPTIQVKSKRNGNGNHTHERHSTREDTVEALRNFSHGLTWRVCADKLDYPPSYAATLSAVCAGRPGAISREGENVLRARLGLRPVWRAEVWPCPSCGKVHGENLDCHGKPVAAVVILSDDERIVKRARKPRKRPRYHRPCIKDEDWPAFLAWKAEQEQERRREGRQRRTL